jgi:hypothetical protein
MAFRDRLRRAERRLGLDRKLPCAACGGRIVIEEIDENGVSTFPGGPPCTACGSSSTEAGAVSWLVYTVENEVTND